MKKLHPKFDYEDDNDEFIYSSEDKEESTDTNVDPRWKKLKDLK